MASEEKDPQLIGGDPSTELSSNRTAMSIDRTHMSIDRTLMSVVRTSLSLIGFGFTIFQVFHNWIDKMPGAVDSKQPREVALILIGLGILILFCGLIEHWRSCNALDERRAALHDKGLIRHRKKIRPSSSAVVAILLLATGLLTFASIVFRMNAFNL